MPLVFSSLKENMSWISSDCGLLGAKLAAMPIEQNH